MTTRVEHLVLMVLTKRNGETENCRQKRFMYMLEKSKQKVIYYCFVNRETLRAIQ